MKTEGTENIFTEQVNRLLQVHYLILYWSASCEDKKISYNITNAFDDLKQANITRTKQSAVAAVTALETLCFLDVRIEQNRKNLYITNYGALALKAMVMSKRFEMKKSYFLENSK